MDIKKESPTESDVHIPSAMGSGGKKPKAMSDTQLQALAQKIANMLKDDSEFTNLWADLSKGVECALCGNNSGSVLTKLPDGREALLCQACADGLMGNVSKSDTTLVEIIKADDEKHLMYAVVYAPNKIDSQGDMATSDEIEKMAHDWLINSRAYDFQHQMTLPADAVQVVQSYIAVADFQHPTADGSKLITKGSWIVVSYVPHGELWSQIKKGLIRAYSIRGYGTRVPLYDVPEMS